MIHNGNHNYKIQLKQKIDKSTTLIMQIMEHSSIPVFTNNYGAILARKLFM
jgi:hypothetical protein